MAQHRASFSIFFCKRSSFLRTLEVLGPSESTDSNFRTKNDRGGIDGSSETASTDFVSACHQSDSKITPFYFWEDNFAFRRGQGVRDDELLGVLKFYLD